VNFESKIIFRFENFACRFEIRHLDSKILSSDSIYWVQQGTVLKGTVYSVNTGTVVWLVGLAARSRRLDSSAIRRPMSTLTRKQLEYRAARATHAAADAACADATRAAGAEADAGIGPRGADGPAGGGGDDVLHSAGIAPPGADFRSAAARAARATRAAHATADAARALGAEAAPVGVGTGISPPGADFRRARIYRAARDAHAAADAARAACAEAPSVGGGAGISPPDADSRATSSAKIGLACYRLSPTSAT
jgi:hypothetical protein